MKREKQGYSVQVTRPLFLAYRHQTAFLFFYGKDIVNGLNTIFRQLGSVLVSRITARGVVLNIQAENIVILCEPQWKPLTEEQAISRAYRMGRSRNVVVYRLLTENCIDVSMLEVLGDKAQ